MNPSEFIPLELQDPSHLEIDLVAITSYILSRDTRANVHKDLATLAALVYKRGCNLEKVRRGLSKDALALVDLLVKKYNIISTARQFPGPTDLTLGRLNIIIPDQGPRLLNSGFDIPLQVRYKCIPLELHCPSGCSCVPRSKEWDIWFFLGVSWKVWQDFVVNTGKPTSTSIMQIMQFSQKGRKSIIFSEEWRIELWTTNFGYKVTDAARYYGIRDILMSNSSMTARDAWPRILNYLENQPPFPDPNPIIPSSSSDPSGSSGPSGSSDSGKSAAQASASAFVTLTDLTPGTPGPSTSTVSPTAETAVTKVTSSLSKTSLASPAKFKKEVVREKLFKVASVDAKTVDRSILSAIDTFMNNNSEAIRLAEAGDEETQRAYYTHMAQGLGLVPGGPSTDAGKGISTVQKGSRSQ